MADSAEDPAEAQVVTEAVIEPLWCSACSREYPGGANFCGECGTRLGPKPSPSPQPPAPPQTATTDVGGDIRDPGDTPAASTGPVVATPEVVQRQVQVAGGDIHYQRSAATPGTGPAGPGVTLAQRQIMVAGGDINVSFQAASAAYREDLEERRNCLERLPRTMANNLVSLDPADVERWAQRLHASQILLLSCVDQQVLNAAARSVPYHNLFSGHDRLQLVPGETPRVLNILGSRTGGRAVVTVYAASKSAQGFLASLPGDPFQQTNLKQQLETSHTWLFVLMTPGSARAEGIDTDTWSAWTESRVDFVGPRLHAVPGADDPELESEFQRQVGAGQWGDSDERTVQLIDRYVADGTLRHHIEQARTRRDDPAPTERPPDWSALLNAGPPEERTFHELILFTAAFFREHPDEPLPGLSVDSLDGIIRALIPPAAADAGLPAGATPDERPAVRLERLWGRQAPRLLNACGIRILKSSSGGMVAALGDRLWRTNLVGLFEASEYRWVFGRVANYVRQPTFVLGSEDLSRGAIQVAAAQARASATYDDRILVDWVLSCVPSSATNISDSDRLAALWQGLSNERRHRLVEWVADVVREWGQLEPALSAVGRFVDLRAHPIAAGVLRSLWGASGFREACLALAVRLLSEAPGDIKKQVIRDMRGAIRQGTLSPRHLWHADWNPSDGSISTARDRVAASLLVEVCESSLAGLHVHSPLREIHQAADEEQLQGLISCLWHPVATAVIEERAMQMAALPGLWMFPLEQRRRVLGDSPELAQNLLFGWWEGFVSMLDPASDSGNLVPPLFRAMTLTDWLMSFPDEDAARVLADALRRVVPKADFARLRRFLGAADAGFGRVVETVLSGPVMPASERRELETHLKALRNQLRRLRRLASASAATDA